MLAAIVAALLRWDGTKILPASRIFTEPKLFLFPCTARLDRKSVV
jgi:hypothetical protein